jgi:hypothetical protein
LKLINQILFCSWSELEALGVDVNTINLGCRRYRKGIGKGWENIPDPSDKRRCLVRYEAIPAATIKACGLPSVAEMKTRYAKQAEESGAHTIAAMLPGSLEGDVMYLQNFRVTREEVDALTGEIKIIDLGGLPDNKIQEYLRQAQWLRLAAHPIWASKTERMRVLGKKTQEETMAAIVAMAEQAGVKLPSKLSRLMEKIREYQSQGIGALIHASYGNAHARKVDETAEAIIRHLYNHKNKPTAALVHENYLRKASKSNGRIQPVSARTITRRLSRVDNQQQTRLTRDGLSAFTNAYLYSQKGKGVSASDLLWETDGTKLNLAYQAYDSKGNLTGASQLKMIVVMDAYSGAFIGWYISQTERTVDVAAAVRNAIARSGNRLPAQFIYDNASSNASFFKDRYTYTHNPVRPYHGQSKQIEQALNQIQEKVLRKYDNFTGKNVTAKSQRSRVNTAKTSFDSHLSVKPADLPTIEEVCLQAEEAIRIWNHTPNKKGISPWDKYLQGQKAEHERYATEADMIRMFYQIRKDTVQYTKGGMVLTKGGQKRHYEVYAKIEDGICYPDVHFHVRYASKALLVGEDMHLQDAPLALYDIDSEGQPRFAAWAHSKVEIARAKADYEQTTAQQIIVNRHAYQGQVGYLRERYERDKQISQTHDVALVWTSKDAEHAAEEEIEREAMGWAVAVTTNPEEAVLKVRKTKPQTVTNSNPTEDTRTELQRKLARLEELERLQTAMAV